MRQRVFKNNDRGVLTLDVISAIKSLPKDKMIEVVIRDPARTSKQNRAMHKFFDIIATELNDNNMFFSKDLLKEGYEADWSPTMIKELLWRPIQKKLTDKESTTKLTTAELTLVSETLQQGLAKWGMDIPFPSIESLIER